MRKFALRLVLVVCALLFLFNPYRLAETLTLHRSLSGHALRLVDGALTNNLKMFATLSSIKGAMAMVEGSTVGASLGASVEVEVGDFIEPAYDYLDFVWNLFLYAILALTVYKLLLESGLLASGLFIAGAGILIFVSVLLFPKITPLRKFGIFLIRGGLLFAFGLSLALFLSNAVGSRYFSPLKEEAHKKIALAEEQFMANKDKFFALRSSWFSGNVKETVQEVATAMGEAAMSTFTTALYYTAVVLFELLLLPFITVIMISIAFGRGFSGIRTRR